MLQFQLTLHLRRVHGQSSSRLDETVRLRSLLGMAVQALDADLFERLWHLEGSSQAAAYALACHAPPLEQVASAKGAGEDQPWVGTFSAFDPLGEVAAILPRALQWLLDRREISSGRTATYLEEFTIDPSPHRPLEGLRTAVALFQAAVAGTAASGAGSVVAGMTGVTVEFLQPTCLKQRDIPLVGPVDLTFPILVAAAVRRWNSLAETFAPDTPRLDTAAWRELAAPATPGTRRLQLVSTRAWSARGQRELTLQGLTGHACWENVHPACTALLASAVPLSLGSRTTYGLGACRFFQSDE